MGINRIKKLLEKELVFPSTHKAYIIWLKNWSELDSNVKNKTINAILLDLKIASILEDI